MRNSYADPTANTAIANVDRERRREEERKKRQQRKEYEQYLRELKLETLKSRKAEGKNLK